MYIHAPKKISSPIPMRITPPKMVALSASFMPKRFPRKSPAMQMAKVTIPMMILASIALAKGYSAKVKPTESASMEVASPWSKRYAGPR